MSETLDAALRYARRGWAVFPLWWPTSHGLCACKTPDCDDLAKHPIGRCTPHGLKDATTDPETIRRWWRQYPHANVGVATGAASGIVVLDVDADKGGAESLAALEARYGALPWTVESITGSGGRHIFFTHPGGHVPNSAGKLGPGLDVRGDGGYVVLPPSQHRSGKRYEWEVMHHPDDVPLAPPPDWLVGLMRAASPSAANGHERLDTAAVLAGVPQGQRDDMLFRLASKLRRADVPREVAERLVCEAAAKCSPPFPEDKALEKVAGAYARYAPAPVREPEGEEPEPWRPTFYSAPELLEMEFPEPKWAVPGIIPEGLTLLVGRPKIGKSWAMLQVAIAVASGGAALGKVRVDAGDVLYLALEDTPQRLQDRLVKLSDNPPPRLTLATDWPRFGAGGELFLKQWLDEHPKARLVVVDTLARIRPRGEKGVSQYDLDYAAGAELKRVADQHGVAIVVLHHQRKLDADDPLDTVSGTLGLTGAADTILILRRERGRHDAALFVTGRDVDEQELALKWDGLAGTWTIVGNAEEWRQSEERRQILEVVEASDKPVSPSDVVAALQARGIHKENGAVRFLMFTMAREGQLGKVGRGKYMSANNANKLTIQGPGERWDVSDVSAHVRANENADEDAIDEAPWELYEECDE